MTAAHPFSLEKSVGKISKRGTAEVLGVTRQASLKVLGTILFGMERVVIIVGTVGDL